MTDEEKIDAFCKAIKEYWANCSDELKTGVKVGCLKPKLPLEDYLKGGLACVWIYHHLKTKENRRFQIVE